MSYIQSVIELLQEYANENGEIREILQRFHEGTQTSKRVKAQLEGKMNTSLFKY